MSNDEAEFEFIDAEFDGVDDEVDDEDTQEIRVPKKRNAFMQAVRTMAARFVINWMPFLLRRCRFGNGHWRWMRICTCGFGALISPEEEGGWHGGLLDLATDKELIPCTQCHPQISPHYHQWHLTNEEEHLLDAWRNYRTEVLDDFGEKHPYRYELRVKLNDTAETMLLGRTQGLNSLASGRGIFSDSTRQLPAGKNKPN